MNESDRSESPGSRDTVVPEVTRPSERSDGVPVAEVRRAAGVDFSGASTASGSETSSNAVPDTPEDFSLRDHVPRLRAGSRQRGTLAKAPNRERVKLSPQQRLLLLDTWKRSALPAGDFACLTGVSKHTLYAWKKSFQEEGPAGLMDKARNPRERGKISDLTQRTILMIKESNPNYGCERISLLLLRGPGLAASPSTVARVLHDAGYEVQEEPTHPHGQTPKRFEREKPLQLWQSDLFTFVLKRQNRRVYLVAFLDDHSRFIVGYGLYASPSTALVLEVLRASIISCGRPEEILTDNGSQYVTWRGTSAFSRELARQGIRHIVARPRRPQTLGKIERFWGTLWNECVERAIFLDLEDARRRIGLFIDHYNFHRPNQGIGGLVPADRFFGAAPEVLRALRDRVAHNALELARDGAPRRPFYLTGQIGGKLFSVHTVGDRLLLKREGEESQEIDLSGPAPDAAVPSEVIQEVQSKYQAWAAEAPPAAGPTGAILPEPVVSHAAPQNTDDDIEAGQEEPPGPGESSLDRDLEQALYTLAPDGNERGGSK